MTMSRPKASAPAALCSILILAVSVNCSSLDNYWRPQSFAVRAMPLLSVLAPAVEEFFVDPAAESSVSGRAGTKLFFPKDAFALPADYRVGGQVKVELTEAMDTASLLAAGINLRVGEGMLESAGMFRLYAYYNNRPVKLARSATVTVPTNGDGRGFAVYHYRDGQWRLRGHNQVQPGDCAPKSTSVRIHEGTADRRMAMIRRFPDVDRMGWWNFDLPKPGIVCLRARLSTPVSQKNLGYLSVIGVDYRGVYARWVDERSFEINAPATTRVRLLAVDEQGLAGTTGVLTTWSRSGFQRAGNSKDLKRPETGDLVQAKRSVCQDVGVINMVQVPKEVWSDPVAVRARFQL